MWNLASSQTKQLIIWIGLINFVLNIDNIYWDTVTPRIVGFEVTA